MITKEVAQEQLARCNTLLEHVIDYHTKHGGTDGVRKCVHEPEKAIREYQNHLNQFANGTAEALEQNPRERLLLKGEMLQTYNRMKTAQYDEEAA